MARSAQAVAPFPGLPPPRRRPRRAGCVAAALAALLAGLAPPLAGDAEAVVSVRLTDVIKSSGSGSIDLLKNATAQALEALRVEHGGKLVFGVDVNEAASGTEKSSSQGITLETVRLTVRYNDSSTAIYTLAAGQVSTETQALVAKSGSTTRLLRHTLLGESGSSRITSGNAIQNDFDSTMTVLVSSSFFDPAANRYAVGAVLDIALLPTDEHNGDPEAFYDFSGGYEDLALLNRPDAAFLDAYAAGRDEAPTVIVTNPTPEPTPAAVSTWNDFPSADGFYLVAYEDLYPQVGDYDFNDLVVAYRVRLGLDANNKVIEIEATAYLVARGAAYSHDWHLGIHLPHGAGGRLACTLALPGITGTVPCSPANATAVAGSVNATMFSDTRSIFPDAVSSSVFVNTRSSQSYLDGPKAVLSIVLDAPLSPNTIGAAPFDPWIRVRDTNRTVKLLEVDPSYTDANGNPFGMLMPNDWRWPYERVAIDAAYPWFREFVSTKGGGSTNWYENPVAGRIFTDFPGAHLWAW